MIIFLVVELCCDRCRELDGQRTYSVYFDYPLDPDDYAHQMTRKQRVSQWLRETNKSVTEEEVIPDPKSVSYLQG